MHMSLHESQHVSLHESQSYAVLSALSPRH